MLSKLRRKVTYANVVATLALFIALGGGAYASSKLAKNSVGSRQIQKNSITSSKIKNGSLLAADFKAGQLPRGATGAQGPKGDTGAAGPLLDTLPSGKTLYGTYAILGDRSGSGNDRQAATISFQFPLTAAPTRAVFVPSGGSNPDATNCAGSATAPTATPGTLCVYEGVRVNTSSSKLCAVAATGGCGPSSGTSDRFGTSVETFAAADGVYISSGTWAVTAP
jgi:hypothetical protein